MPKVSIVIDNYNYERFLARAIQSALDQTHDDVEVIVVDDGSTDGSLAVAHHFSDRISVVAKENGGQASALNAGFEASTGDLIIFLDADDELLPTAAARAVAQLRPGVGKIHWRLQSVDATGAALGFTNPPADRQLPQGDVTATLARTGRYVTPVMSGNAFPRSVLQRVLPMPEDGFRIAADGYVVTAAAFHGDVVAIDDKLGLYRIHGNNFWAPDQVSPERLQQFVRHDRAKQSLVIALAGEKGMAVSPDLGANDHFHLCNRLASLRLNKTAHPVPGDTRPSLTGLGIRATLGSSLNWPRKVAFCAWFLAVGAGPARVARLAIDTLYVPQRRRVGGGEQHWEVRDPSVADRVRRRSARITSDLSLVLPGRARRRRVHYLGFVGHDNMGDEALLIAHEQALSPLPLLPFPDPVTLSALALVHPRRALIGGAVLGGGTLIGRKAYRRPLEKMHAAFPDAPLVMLGTGVEDPEFYGPEAHLWRDELLRWRDLLGSIDEVSVRGPGSQELLASIGVKSQVVGDSALLIDPVPAEARPRLLGINLGAAKRIWGQDLPSLITVTAEAANALIGMGWHVRLVPVSPRDVEPLAHLARMLTAEPDVVSGFRDLRTLLQATGETEVFVGQKLHSAVFAAGQAVPCVALEYHPKCRDFQRSIGSEANTVRTDAVTADDLVKRVLDLSVRRDEVRSHLRETVGSMRADLSDAAARARARLGDDHS